MHAPPVNFYHLRPAHKPDVTASFDLLWNGIEVTTGAQREHRYNAQERGMHLASLRVRRMLHQHAVGTVTTLTSHRAIRHYLRTVPTRRKR
jgi:hypothetical protein